MNQEKVSKCFRQAVIAYIIFVLVAIIMKVCMIKFLNEDIRLVFGFFTIFFTGFLGAAPLTMGYWIAASSVFISYFAGLIWHAIADTVYFSRLLIEPYGLYQRIFLIVCLSVIGVVIECIYQYIKNKKMKKKKESLDIKKAESSSDDEKDNPLLFKLG